MEVLVGFEAELGGFPGSSVGDDLIFFFGDDLEFGELVDEGSLFLGGFGEGEGGGEDGGGEDAEGGDELNHKETELKYKLNIGENYALIYMFISFGVFFL